MTLIRNQAATPLTTPNGNIVTSLATPSRGARELSVIRQCQRPGGFNPLHSQTREEVMVQLRGRVTVTCAGQETLLEPGDTLIIAAGVLHEIANAGDEDAERLLAFRADVTFHAEDGAAVHPAWLE